MLCNGPVKGTCVKYVCFAASFLQDVSWTMNSAGITSSGNVMLFSSSSLCKFTLLIQNTTLSSGEAIFRCHLNDVPTEKSVGVTLRLASKCAAVMPLHCYTGSMEADVYF